LLVAILVGTFFEGRVLGILPVRDYLATAHDRAARVT